MAKQDKSAESVYRVTEVIGTNAQPGRMRQRMRLGPPLGTLRDLRIAEVVKMDVKIEDGKVRACNSPLSTKASPDVQRRGRI